MSAHDQGFAEINGARLYYEVAGDGPPLILLHAGITDSRMWDAQFDTFARTYRTVRYDVRGFGRSVSPPGPYTMREDLAALLDFLGIARAHLIGVSMSGSIVIDFALSYPDRVGALIPVAMGIGGATSSAYLDERDRENATILASGDVDAANEAELRLWLDGVGRPPGTAVDPGVRERVREMNAPLITAQINDTGEHQSVNRLTPPAIERLEEITAPTLAIVGAHDVPDMLTNADAIVARVPGARKVIMPGVAHLPPMEAPEEFNRIILDFLREVDAGQ
jgi:3-oxoadipate enol-lactonase